MITNRGIYRYSSIAYEEHPDELSRTADARIAPSAFDRMPELFLKDRPSDGNEYILILGNSKSEKRVKRWIRSDYVNHNHNLDVYKVAIPKAIGSGRFGEKLSDLEVLAPGCGFTETFISVGDFKNAEEAEACLKYLKTKFARALLGILKVTQNNAKPTWRKIPLQDFGVHSKVDWSLPIQQIDKQLYELYGLKKDEIDFIESHVEAMD